MKGNVYVNKQRTPKNISSSQKGTSTIYLTVVKESIENEKKSTFLKLPLNSNLFQKSGLLKKYIFKMGPTRTIHS